MIPVELARNTVVDGAVRCQPDDFHRIPASALLEELYGLDYRSGFVLHRVDEVFKFAEQIARG